MTSRLLMAALSAGVVLVSGPVGPLGAGQATPSTRAPMPSDRARATFADARVRTFLAAADRDFGGRCALPDPAQTDASVVQRGGGDFSSASYEIVVPCPGRDGLVEAHITAEFSPPLGTPLDMTLSLVFRR